MRQNAKLLSQILDSLQRYDPKSHHFEQTQFVNSLGCAGLKISPAFDLDRRGPDGPSLAAPSRPKFDGGKGLKKPPRYSFFSGSPRPWRSLSLATVMLFSLPKRHSLSFVFIAQLSLVAIVPSCPEAKIPLTILTLTELTILIRLKMTSLPSILILPSLFRRPGLDCDIVLSISHDCSFLERPR